MERLDAGYLAGVARVAARGDSDAFAELYAATYRKQYTFAWKILGDTDLAQYALQDTYILALKGIGDLRDPRLFLPWLTQINFRTCCGKLTGPRKEVEIGKATYSISRILALPFLESQAVYLHFALGMKPSSIAELLEESPSRIKSFLKSGQARLRKTI